MEIEVQLVRRNFDGIADEEHSVWHPDNATAIPARGDCIDVEGGGLFKVTGRQFQYLPASENSDSKLTVYVFCDGISKT